MTNQKGQFAPGRYWYWLIKPPPAAHDKLAEESAIDREHYGCRAHRPARTGGNRCGSSRVMLFGNQCQIAADIRKRRLCQHPAWHRCENVVRMQQLAR